MGTLARWSLSYSATICTALVLLASACGRQEFVSQPGVYCSIKNEDPHFTCTKFGDVICINTYSFDRVRPSGEIEQVPQYSCRQACDPAIGCTTSDQVCCPGTVFGRNPGAKTHACTPFGECQVAASDAGTPTPRRDAATLRDLRVPVDAGAEAGSGEILVAIDAPMAAGLPVGSPRGP